MVIVIASQSKSIPSYTFDAGDVSLSAAQSAAYKIARQWARSINGAGVESVYTYDVEKDEDLYEYVIRERDWSCVLFRTVETVRVSISR